MNKTSSIDLPVVVQNGELVHRWLGNLWLQLFQDTEFVHRNNQASGLLSAQLYLNFMETTNLLNRHNAPVFHRERWHLITLKVSTRNTGNAVAARLGSRYVPKIGKQNEAPFVPGSMVQIGGHTAVAGVTTYPLDASVSDILTTITDNIVSPGKVLVRGVDFYVEDQTLVFVNDNDPFTLGFPVRTTGGDQEVALWASDTLMDNDFTYNFSGYVLGIRDVSSEFYAAYVNALWDMHNMGTPTALFMSGIAAILGEPYVLDTAETVVDVIQRTDTQQIVTDTHVYSVPASAVLRASVKVGSVLLRGELLTETVRMYDNIDPARLTGNSEYGSRIRQDIDALLVTPGFLRTPLRHGIGLSWNNVPITFHGYDANDNPKVRFALYGSQDDVDAFWADFWDQCEQAGVSSATCLAGHLRDTLLAADNAVWGSVSPMEFFLHNFLKANLLVIALDGDKLSVSGRQSMHLLTALNHVIPAHVCLLIMERRTLPTDEYDMGDQLMDTVKPLYTKALYEVAGADEYARTRLTYGDARPVVRFIAKCSGVTNDTASATV